MEEYTNWIEWGSGQNGLLKGWILRIEDCTEVATKIGELVELGQLDAAERLLPAEIPYVFLEESTRIACQAD